MRRRGKRESLPDELALAIGLIWGHLNVGQYEEAYQLAQGCLCIWPEEVRLRLMSAYAAVELLEPLDDATQALLQSGECQEWADLVLRRSEYQEYAPENRQTYLQ